MDKILSLAVPVVTAIPILVGGLISVSFLIPSIKHALFFTPLVLIKQPNWTVIYLESYRK
jgi:hypothetical protein